VMQSLGDLTPKPAAGVELETGAAGTDMPPTTLLYVRKQTSGERCLGGLAVGWRELGLNIGGGFYRVNYRDVRGKGGKGCDGMDWW